MDNNTLCKECPLRLYNSKGYHLEGVGNAWSGRCIVVPNVDYRAYKSQSMSFSTQVQLINDVIISATGVEESNVYIIPLIRCNETVSNELDNDSYKRCLTYFANDMKMYKFHHVLLLGSAVRRFLNVNISDYLDKDIISKNGVVYSSNYSPLIKYTNDNLFNVFKKHLIHWYTTKL